MTEATTLEEANAELTLRLRQQELVAEFAMFTIGCDDVQPILDQACAVAARGMECSFAKVLEHLPDEHAFLVRAGIGWRPGVVGSVKLGDDLASPAGYAFRTGEPVISNHLEGETRFRTPALLVDHGVKRAVNVLVATLGRSFGVLEADSPDSRMFTLTDTIFLQSLAGMLAHALMRHERMLVQRNTDLFAQSILDASPDCVQVLDGDGTLLLMNGHGLRLLEISDAAQVIGQPWKTLWPAEQHDQLAAAIREAAAGELARFDASRPMADGRLQWWDVFVQPIDGVGAQRRRLVVVARDISERVAASEAKDLLMLEVHHRVKNSLQMVQNLLSLQGRASEDADASGQLLESAARVRTIAAIHDRLYKTSAALTVEVGPYLHGLVEDLRIGMASTLDGRSIDLESDAVTWAAVEMPTLGLVLTELVTNALKYGSGAITVRFRQPAGSHGVLTVHDQGDALPADFDPVRSRGLGMRLVNGMLRGAHSGLVVDRSQPGTCFVATLPPPRGFKD